MSYILDALKKLELEKTTKARGERVIGISGGLFENERQKPSGSAGWKIAFAVAVAVMVTFAGTWQYFQYGKAQKSVSQQIVASIPPAPAPMPSSEIVPATSVPVPQRASAQIMPAKAQTIVQPAPRPPIQPKVPQVQVQAIAPAEDAAAIVNQQELRRRLKDRKAQAAPAAPTIAPPADIKLSGIAYQDERRARRAVVNGFLVQEGGVVSGAVITDIFQDRVRFSLAGGSFELSLVSSAGPVSGK
jgi:general secretion pathway protein B